MTRGLFRAALSHPAFTGVIRHHFAELVFEPAPRGEVVRESDRAERRGGERHRAAGAGRKPKLVFSDRLLLTLNCLRHQLPHATLAELYLVDRSTVSTAVREIRALLAKRGFAVPDRPGLRLHTLEDLFAHAEAEGVDLRIDRTEVQVRRPRHRGPPGRRSCRGRSGGTRSRRPASATTRAAPCCPGSCGRVGCTTRPVCAAGASPSSSVSIPG
ncbi:transposase family protein [Streptomyces sp. NPDC021056]|uniref:helix-turn-helix domain-containing protein n=1 Tax=Streptomyces sp. NPDC021056 TaxID=3155012 RepID=UPI0033E8F11B